MCDAHALVLGANTVLRACIYSYLCALRTLPCGKSRTSACVGQLTHIRFSHGACIMRYPAVTTTLPLIRAISCLCYVACVNFSRIFVRDLGLIIIDTPIKAWMRQRFLFSFCGRDRSPDAFPS